MSTTRVVNIRSEDCDVFIGRGPGGMVAKVPGTHGYFGNPFALRRESERELVLEQYRAYFDHRVSMDPTFVEELKKLKGKRLGCFCAPALCHGSVIVEWVEKNA
jgi:hypothetical protein